MKTDLTAVDFHGATLLAVRGETPAETMVAMKPVVEGMGLDWEGQRQRIARNPVLAKGACEIQVPSADGPQAMTALPLSRLSFWLATIQPNKVPDAETRARVIRYQEECADVLFAHFFGQAAGRDGGGPSEAMVARMSMLSRVIEALVDRLDALEQRSAQRELELIAERKKAESRHAVEDRISVLELLEQVKAIQKGRRSINGRLGHALRVAAAAAGVAHEKDAHSRVWLFPIDFALRFMAQSGNAMVADHNAAQTGQGVLPFPERPRKPPLTTVAPEVSP